MTIFDAIVGTVVVVLLQCLGLAIRRVAIAIRCFHRAGQFDEHPQGRFIQCALCNRVLSRLNYSAWRDVYQCDMCHQDLKANWAERTP